MGHLNSFSASGGGFEQKFSKNSNAQGIALGDGCLSFDFTGTLHVTIEQNIHKGMEVKEKRLD